MAKQSARMLEVSESADANVVPTKALAVTVVDAADEQLPSVIGIEVGDHVVYLSGGYGGRDRNRLLATSDGKKLHRRYAPDAGLRCARIIGNELWLVGEYGTCAVSTDNAATWTEQKIPTNACLWDIGRDSKGALWIAGSGNTLLKSTKSGQPFKDVTHSQKPRDDRTNPRVKAVPVGLMFLLFGAYWNGKQLVKPKGLKGALTSLAIAPSGTIIVVGDKGAAFRSLDGGATYKPVTTGVSAHLNDIAIVGGGFLAVGEKGTLRRSEDDGVTWKPLASNTKLELRSIGSWGTGAYVGGEQGLLLRIESPGDTYWKGAVDIFGPRPVVPADISPLKAAARKELDARYDKLLAEAQTAHAAYAKKLAAPKVPVDDHAKSILAAIDDIDEYKVYGDILQAANDPHGELVALQTAEQTKAATAYLKKHKATLLGPLADDLPHVDLSLTWRWGFLYSARLAVGDEDIDSVLDDEDDEVDVAGNVPHWTAVLLDAPAARFLQKLTVGLVTRYDNTYGKVIAEIGRRPRPALRDLELGDFTSEETETSWSNIGDITKLCGALDRLERLSLHSGSMSFGKPGQLVFPSLKALEIITGGFSKAHLKALLAAHLPSLERLTLYFGTERYGCDIVAKDLQPLLATDRFPRLKRLGLRNAEFSDELCKVMHTSTLVARVTELDLSEGTLSNEGARSLATYAAGLQHLEKLEVGRSYLTKDGIKLVKKAFPNAELGVDEQRIREGEEFARRYVAVSE